MRVSDTYNHLAEKIYSKIYQPDNEYINKKESIKSIISQFYAIEALLQRELQINIKRYYMIDRIEIIEMLYVYKNFYYSKELIIKFIEKFYKDINEINIIDKFLEFKKTKKIFEKEYNNLLVSQRICNEEKKFDVALKKIEKEIDNNEVNMIKRIKDCTLSEAFLNDLKKYYLRTDLENDIRYSDLVAFMQDIQLTMSDRYYKFLKKLQHKFLNENIINSEKNTIYGEINNLLNRIKKALKEIKFLESENKQDLLALFYIRLKRCEIGKILKFEEKLLKFLEEQADIFKLKDYEEKVNTKSTKITEISKDVIITKDNITKSNIRSLQLENKNMVSVLEEKYKNKLKRLDNKGKIKKVLLREINLSKNSKKIELEKEEKLNLKQFKLSKIINKIKNENELSNEENIFIESVIDRGIVLENGKLDEALMINEIDIKILEIILEIYYINNVFQIEICTANVFEQLNFILNKKRKK